MKIHGNEDKDCSDIYDNKVSQEKRMMTEISQTDAKVSQTLKTRIYIERQRQTRRE